MSSQSTTNGSAPSLDKIEVPRSFELYVDGAKWLLAIIAGLLAYGFAALKDHPDGRALLFFAISAVCLTLAAGCTLYYLLMSYTYLSRREGSKPESSVTSAKRQSDRAFMGMLWAFAAGLLFFVLFGASQLVTLQSQDEAQIFHIGSSTHVIVQRGDKAWTLVRASDGTIRWEQLPTLPES